MFTFHKSSASRPQKALCIILLLCLQISTQAASPSILDNTTDPSPTIAASAARFTPTHNLPARLWVSSEQTALRLRKRAAPSPATQPKSSKKAATASSTAIPPPDNHPKSATHAKHASDPAAIDSGGHSVKKDGAGGDAVAKKTSKKAAMPVGGAASVPINNNTTDADNKEFRDEEDPQADTKTILIAMCASLGGLACCFCCLLGLSRVAGCCYVRRLQQNRRHHRDVLPVEHFVVCEPSSPGSRTTIGASKPMMHVSGPLDEEKRVDGAAAPRILSQFWNVPESKGDSKKASRGFFRNQRQVDSTAGRYITSPMDHVSERPGVQPYSPSHGQPMPPSPCRSKRMPSPAPIFQAALKVDMPQGGDYGTEYAQGPRKQGRPDPIDTGRVGYARGLSPSTTPYRSHTVSPDEGYHSAVDRTYYQ
ncbi:hypothetical protein EC968_006554 [Mortierella alpina]|nr:hypothetical protein EC968_006554 [Mortierella alpina]